MQKCTRYQINFLFVINWISCRITCKLIIIQSHVPLFTTQSKCQFAHHFLRENVLICLITNTIPGVLCCSELDHTPARSNHGAFVFKFYDSFWRTPIAIQQKLSNKILLSWWGICEIFIMGDMYKLYINVEFLDIAIHCS